MPRSSAPELLLAAVVLVLSARLSRAASWETFESHNCYERNGGFRITDGAGGVVPLNDITLDECKRQCEEDKQCEGVLTIHRHSLPDQPPQGPCWFRQDINEDDCFDDTGSEPYDLHVKNGGVFNRMGRGIANAGRRFNSQFANPFSEVLFMLLLLAVCVLGCLVAKAEGLLAQLSARCRTLTGGRVPLPTCDPSGCP